MIRDSSTGAPIRLGIALIDTDMETSNLAAQLMSEALLYRFSGIEGLEVRSIGYTVDHIISGNPLATAREIGVDWLIGGVIEQTPGSPNEHMSLTLWNVPKDRRLHLGVFGVPKPVDQDAIEKLVDIRDRIVAYTIARLPGELDPASPWFELPTTFADYEAYSRAQERLEQEDCDPHLVDVLLPIVDRNPNFGQAWMTLSYAYYNRFWACGASAAEITKSVAAADRLLTIVPEGLTGRRNACG